MVLSARVEMQTDLHIHTQIDQQLSSVKGTGSHGPGLLCGTMKALAKTMRFLLLEKVDNV